jgi:hypothetical protein
VNGVPSDLRGAVNGELPKRMPLGLPEAVTWRPVNWPLSR